MPPKDKSRLRSRRKKGSSAPASKADTDSTHPPQRPAASSGHPGVSSVTINTESINVNDAFVPTGKGGFTTTARYESSKPLGRDTFTGRQSRGEEKKRHKQPPSSTSPGGTTSAGGHPVSRQAANLAGAAAPPNEDEKAADERELSRENLDHQRRNLTSRGKKKKKMKSGTPLQTAARGAKSMAKSAGSTLRRATQGMKNQLKNPFKMSTTTSTDEGVTDKAAGASSSSGESDGDEYFPNADEEGEDEDEDEEYLENLSDLEQDDKEEEINDAIADCKHEMELDLDDQDINDDGTKEQVVEMVVKDANALLDIVGTAFRAYYNKLAATNADVMDGLKRLKREIISLIVYAKQLDLSKYQSALELEEELNAKREAIGEAMVQALKDEEHNDLISHINLGTKFSIKHLITFIKHYAPLGTKSVDGDKFDKCHPGQCCVHTMFSKLLNYYINEEKEGPEKMKKWKYGGGTDEDKHEYMAVNDLIPFLLAKMDNDTDMLRQYEEIRGKLGLDSIYDLMAIPFCLMELRLKLFDAARRDEARRDEDGQTAGEELEGPQAPKRHEFHFCSSAASKYMLGLSNGTVKYLNTYNGSNFRGTVGIHAQSWLMGIIKNRNMFPEYIAKLIAHNLLLVYSVVYDFSEDFLSGQSQIIDTFGGSCGSGINLGVYSRLAKFCRNKKLLNLEELVSKEMDSSGNDEETALVNILTRYEFCCVLISFIVAELKTATLLRIMERIRNCSDVQEMNSLRCHLASAFCVHGRDYVASLLEFEFGKYKTLSGLDEEGAWKAIQKVAEGYSYTFQKYLTELKEYKQTYKKTNVVSVGDKSILVVDGDHNMNLWTWYITMIGYNQKNAYGLKVFQYPDSAEYKDMQEQGATFRRELYAKAEENYKENKNVTNTNMGVSRQGLLGGLSL